MPGLYNRYTRKPLPLRSVRATSKLKGLSLGTTLTLVYVNESAINVDAIFVVALGEHSVISHFEANTSRAHLTLNITEKFEPDYLFEVDEPNESAVLQRGDFIVDQHQNHCYFTANTGPVPANKEAILRLSISTQCDVTDTGAVRFFLPSVCTPRYIHRHRVQVPIDVENTLSFILNPSREQLEKIPNLSNLAQKIEQNLMPYNFEFKLEINSPCLLSGVFSPTHEIRVDADFNEVDARNCTITLDGRHEYHTDMEVHIYLSEPNEAHVVVEPGDMSPDEYDRLITLKLEQRRKSDRKAETLKQRFHKDISHIPVCMISFTPNFDHLKAHYGIKGVESFLCEYIFLVDRANTMSGASIANLRETLMLCLKSLPTSCLFNFIGFGSVFKYLFDQSRPYIGDYVSEASKWIKGIKADLGGLDLFGPLEWVFSATPRPGVVRQIFIFTDGCVNNTHQVLELVRNNNHNSRVFSVGIGSRGDGELIFGLASAGNGKHCTVLDDERMQTKVLRLLQSAMCPVLSDIKMDWSLPQDFQVIHSPQEHPACFQGNTITTYGFLFRRVSEPGVTRQQSTAAEISSVIGALETLTSGATNLFHSTTMDSDSRSVSFEERGGGGMNSRQASTDHRDMFTTSFLAADEAEAGCSRDVAPFKRQLTRSSSNNPRPPPPLGGALIPAQTMNHPYKYTYRLVQRHTSHDDDTSKDDDSGYNEARQSQTSSSGGSFNYNPQTDSVRNERQHLRRVLHEMALRRRATYGQQSSSDMSRETEDTFDRVEAWANTGYQGSYPDQFQRRQAYSSSLSNTDTSISVEEEPDQRAPFESKNIIVTVPYSQVPHLSIRGSFGGKPFVRHVPIDISAIVEPSSSSRASPSVIHHLASKSLIRDFERMAYREISSHSEVSRRSRYLRSYDVPKRWKRKIAEVSRANGVPSNYTQCTTMESNTKYMLPKHIYVLAPPNRLVRELSRRSAKQRHSGWTSADNQLRKSTTTDLDEQEAKEIDKLQTAEVLYAKRSNSFRLSTPIADLLDFERQVAAEEPGASEDGSASSAPYKLIRKLQSAWRSKVSHKHPPLTRTYSYSAESTSVQLLVAEQQPEGFWRLDEAVADALEVDLEQLLNASPIVPVPVPKECNCAKDITIMIEDFTESTPPSVRRCSFSRTHPHLPPAAAPQQTPPAVSSRNLVRQVKVGEQDNPDTSNSHYELDDIHYISESDNNGEEAGGGIPDIPEEESCDDWSVAVGDDSTQKSSINAKIRRRSLVKSEAANDTFDGEYRHLPIERSRSNPYRVEERLRLREFPINNAPEMMPVEPVRLVNPTSYEAVHDDTTGSLRPPVWSEPPHLAVAQIVPQLAASIVSSAPAVDGASSVKAEVGGGGSDQEVVIDENLLNVPVRGSSKGRRGGRRTLKHGKDRAVDYEDEIAAENYSVTGMVPSSLSLAVPELNGNFRRGSYDEQAFRERQKILNRDYLKATDPEYYRRAGSVDHTSSKYDGATLPPNLLQEPEGASGARHKGHQWEDEYSGHYKPKLQPPGGRRGGGGGCPVDKRKRFIKKAQPRAAGAARRLSYHTVRRSSSDDVFSLGHELQDDYFINRRKPDSSDNRIWATALVLVWLEKRCQPFKDEWLLLSNKADRWLTEQKLPKSHDLRAIRASASQVLNILSCKL